MSNHTFHDSVLATDAIAAGVSRYGGSIAETNHFPPLANVAHELRTPLQVVLGYLEILREEWAAGLCEEARRILDRMNASAHQLALTVENIMECAHADSMHHPSPIDEHVSIPSVLSELKPSFDAARNGKPLSLIFDLGDTPVQFRSSRRPFRLILENLVLNAIRFGSSDIVTLSVRRYRRINAQPEGVEIEVCTAETDVHAPPHLPVARYCEMDLGLSVVRRNAEALGGTMETRSVPGARSSVIVRIPVQAS